MLVIPDHAPLPEAEPDVVPVFHSWSRKVSEIPYQIRLSTAVSSPERPEVTRAGGCD
jgi:hypothetical protein